MGICETGFGNEPQEGIQFLLVKSGQPGNIIQMQATAVPPNAAGERPGFFLSGPIVVIIEIILLLGALALILFQALERLGSAETNTGSSPIGLFGLLSGFALFILALVILRGFRLMRRDQALVLFSGSRYLGTIRGGGLFWTNPFVSRRKLSLQAHQSTVQHTGDGSRSLTANVTWQVTDTAKALQLSDHYDQAVSQKIDQALVETGGSDDLARFKDLLEQRLGEIGASVRQAELRSGRVAL